MFSETDSYTVIIVRKLELKCNATKVEIDDMRYAFCLPVAPTVMEATCMSCFTILLKLGKSLFEIFLHSVHY